MLSSDINRAGWYLSPCPSAGAALEASRHARGRLRRYCSANRLHRLGTLTRAGEGALGALERVARSTTGVLSQEMTLTLADAQAGGPLTLALRALADRSGLPALARFADGVGVAGERGTPVADVLRHQAQDVRESGRRVLMEQGG